MKPFFVISAFLFFFCLLSTGHAQTTDVKNPRFQKSIKITLPAVFNYGMTGSNFKVETAITVNNPAPSLILQGRKRFWHEFTLTNIAFNKNGFGISDSVGAPTFDRENGSRRFNTGAKYQFTLGLVDLDKKFIPFVGAYSKVYYQAQFIDPLETNQFNQRFRIMTAAVGITPGLRYKIKGKIFVDVGLDFDIVQGLVGSNRSDNPSLPPERQRNSYSEFRVVLDDWVGAWIGVGFNL